MGVGGKDYYYIIGGDEGGVLRVRSIPVATLSSYQFLYNSAFSF